MVTFEAGKVFLGLGTNAPYAIPHGEAKNLGELLIANAELAEEQFKKGLEE